MGVPFMKVVDKATNNRSYSSGKREACKTDVDD